MKTIIKTLEIEMYDIAGVDLRDDKPFEAKTAIEACTSIDLYYH